LFRSVLATGRLAVGAASPNGRGRGASEGREELRAARRETVPVPEAVPVLPADEVEDGRGGGSIERRGAGAAAEVEVVAAGPVETEGRGARLERGASEVRGAAARGASEERGARLVRAAGTGGGAIDPGGAETRFAARDVAAGAAAAAAEGGAEGRDMDLTELVRVKPAPPAVPPLLSRLGASKVPAPMARVEPERGSVEREDGRSIVRSDPLRVMPVVVAVVRVAPDAPVAPVSDPLRVTPPVAAEGTVDRRRDDKEAGT